MKSIIKEYPFVTIWKRVGFPSGVNESAIIGDDSYSGQETGNIYPFNEYYHSEQFLAKVKSVDKKNLTGTYHLCEEWDDTGEENNISLKSELINTELIVEAAHWAGKRRIYRSVYPVEEYWSDLELEIGEKIR